MGEHVQNSSQVHQRGTAVYKRQCVVRAVKKLDPPNFVLFPG
jgi:hypothetical protein